MPNGYRIHPSPLTLYLGGATIKRLIYSLAGVIVLGVAGFMIYQALSSSIVYFVLPSEYAAHPEQYQGQRIRLGGVVKTGSVDYNPQTLQLTFKVTDSIETYPVSHYGAPPELFEENTGVVLEGHFKDGTFASETLLIKHSEVYEAPKPGEPINVEVLKETLQ